MVLLCSRPPGNVQFTKKSVIYVQSYCIAKSVNVFSTKVLIEDTILTSPTGDGAAILRDHTSHAKV